MENNRLLKELDIKVETIKKIGKVTIINDKYVIKEIKHDNKFYEYLISRNFKHFPNIYSNISDDIEIMEYIENKEIPKEQRLEDLVYVDSLLHLTTSFDKVLDIDKIKEIYETTTDKLTELSNYYLNIQNVIEEETYMSPANYLLIRNISLIYKALNTSKKYLDNWYKDIEKSKSLRYAYIHGNLRYSHLLENNKLYLISWDNSRIDFPIKDIEIFYRNSFSDINLKDILAIYEHKYPLKKEEKNLLYANILIPNKINLNKPEYIKIQEVSNIILYVEDVLNYLKDYTKETNNNPNK